MDREEREQELERRIEKLENSLKRLKNQLRLANEKQQHYSIDHLEEYFDEVDRRFNKLSDLWSLMIREVSNLFSSNSRNTQ